jgi:hypothetical protein
MLHALTCSLRPPIELEPTGHPLAVAQREGISFRRAVSAASRQTSAA